MYQNNNVAECGIWTNEKNIIIVLSYNASVDWRKKIETRDIEMQFVPIKKESFEITNITICIMPIMNEKLFWMVVRMLLVALMIFK